MDGAEELYDIVNDPNEWKNLAAERPGVVNSMKKWLPKHNVGPVQGSMHRIFTYYQKTPVWEGHVIGENDPVPQDSL